MSQSPAITAEPFRRGRAIEWPTLCLAIAIYAIWGALTFWHAAIPLLLLVPAAAWTIAWHGSLQHEIIHGHPTRWRRLNRALGFVPLSLWVPFARYRTLHLSHHRDERLTDPLDDPESFYWTDADWEKLSPIARGLVEAQTCLAGRLVIGPAWSILRFLGAEIRAVSSGDRVVAKIWGRHLLGCAAVFAWLWGVCGLSPLAYLLIFVYPGTALQLVRSFAEHKAEGTVSKRTAVVEASPVLSLLFLNNNLHAAHHAHPTLPWYRLPAWYRDNRAALLGANGGLRYAGYRDVFRRFFLAPHDRPAHPLGRVPQVTRGGEAPA
ncbi:fatty acid desaturase [Aurantimonas sp. 22II-16-19i]|uniref:fatty acid desaturase n=1 Tax=Aurantimonas sp. 22II-16-19i TaxID=1317114 RepID=UPI0009F7FD55|nr:fatty acid desaturase [Aurantimonas sp. 22II-16-19i]ORE90463.1 fatty acid desaturase [Aurantimonas sp. 22II-16-19i]